jgi:agmatine/peptidylarginine deiminase
MAKEQFIEIFKGYKILSIDARKLIENGGVLNCMTWSIYQE